MERTIQHETLQLAEEKRLVREIKQLNQQREQLAANTRRQQELQQALDRRVETEEQLKVIQFPSSYLSFYKINLCICLIYYFWSTGLEKRIGCS